jgi:alkylation response protein AidB-like acyl-CoA dehydrogenase
MVAFNLTLDEDQLQIQKWVHDFAEGVVRPAAHEWDEREEFPWPVVEQAAEIGLYGVDFMMNAISDPTGLTLPVAVEELFWGDAGIGMAIMGSGLAAAGIAGNGTPEQVIEWVPQCYGTPDDVRLGAFCVSEPDAGSDVSSLRTRAVYHEATDEWVLNGTKAWITNAGESTWYTVMASTDPERGANGISAFVVHRDDPGFEVGPKERKLGISGSPTREIYFTDCRIPADRIIGAEGTGFKTALRTLDHTRPTIGAQAVGIAQGALDVAIGYVKERKQFGRHLAEFQGLQFMVADMAMKVEAARQLVYVASSRAERGEANLGFISSAAKCLASDTAMSVTTDAVQLLGGAGYTKDFPVERMMRDAKITQIYEGTNQIQRLVMARALLKS